MFEHGIAHTAQAQWPTTADSLDVVLPHALTTTRAKRSSSALLNIEPLFGERCLALVRLGSGTVSISVAAAELVALAEIEEWLRECFPLAEATEEQQVPVTFWSYGSYGATPITRTIAVPTWAEICDNYPTSTCEALRTLVDAEYRPAERGQLVLWYGPPGTGKTYALRALGWEWRSWCDLHYVVDPEVLFGERADYLVEVILDEVDDPKRWRLLVLEDTGELLAADAKERTGQGLSRLLNLVDGIVGQGVRILVLVTTNEQLRQLHPAVARPGRCAARVEFSPFPPDEAAHWLAERDVHEDAGAATLASLYALLGGHEWDRDRPIGFSV